MNKLIQLFPFFFVLTISPTLALAQIDLNSAGKIGIGSSPHSNSKMYVYSTSGNTTDVALRALSSSPSSTYSYGIIGVSEDFVNHARGVYGIAYEGNNSNYAVYGNASGTNSYGGYFTGGLYVSGGITQSSDDRLKTNIQELDRTDISDKIQALRPRQYEFLSPQELQDRNLPASHTDEGTHFGLIAQELEEVFPELVTDVVHVLGEHTGNIDDMEKESPTVTTKAINYQELTVLLLTVVQELQAEVDALKTQLNEER